MTSRRGVGAAVLVAALLAGPLLLVSAAQTAPFVVLTPPCSSSSVWVFNASGQMPNGNYVVRVVFGYGQPGPATFQGQTDANGRFSVNVSVPARGPGSYTVAAFEPDVDTPSVPVPGTYTQATFTSPCATVTTATTRPTTTRPPTPTSSTTSTTTTKPPPTGTTIVTTTTVTTIVEPIPGSPTLVVVPPLGPPGFVARAVGTGFPPGPVELRWSQGPGVFRATADATGAFSQPVLVFPRDRPGRRALNATTATGSLSAPFLVVPGRAQPPDLVRRR